MKDLTKLQGCLVRKVSVCFCQEVRINILLLGKSTPTRNPLKTLEESDDNLNKFTETLPSAWAVELSQP